VITLLLLLLAFVCFVAAALGIPAARINLIALGLAFCVLVPLIGAWPA